MTDKITLNDLATFDNSIIDSVNTNNDTITTAINNTVSRDGTTPNAMGAALDMNGYNIINLPAPGSVNSPVRLTDLNTFSGGGEITVNPLPAGGSTHAVLNKNSGSDFDVAWTNTPIFTTVNCPTVTSTTTNTTTVNSTTSNSVTDNTTTVNAVTANLGVAGSNLGTLTMAGSTSGTMTVVPNVATGTNTLTLPVATDTLVGKATTDTLTNKTFDTAGTGNVFKINGTAVTTKSGTGSMVLSSSPALTSPTLTTPAIGAATGTSLSLTGALTAFSGTTPPSTGNNTTGILLSSTAHLGIFFGTAAPTFTAAKGSLYIRVDTPNLYQNTDNGTTWAILAFA